MEPGHVDLRAAVARLHESAEGGRLDELADRLGVRVLGVFGSASRPGPERPRDVDVAVGFRGPPRELDLLDALTELAGTDRIDLLVLDTADPLARAEGLAGVGLFEAVAGGWATEQMAAIAERFDTAHLRALDRGALRR